MRETEQVESEARSLVSRHRHASTRFFVFLRKCTDAGIDCPKDAPERVAFMEAQETLVQALMRPFARVAASVDAGGPLPLCEYCERTAEHLGCDAPPAIGPRCGLHQGSRTPPVPSDPVSPRGDWTGGTP